MQTNDYFVSNVINIIIVSGLSVNQTGDAFCHLVNDEKCIQLVVPALSVETSRQPLGVLEDPTSPIGWKHLIFSMVKQFLLSITSSRARAKERFEIRQFVPCFDQVLKFRNNKRYVEYSLGNKSTDELDKELGTNWDIVSNRTYMVVALIFKKQKFNPVSSYDKLVLNLDLVSRTCFPTNYRAVERDAMNDQFRSTDDDGRPATLTIPADGAVTDESTFTPDDLTQSTPVSVTEILPTASKKRRRIKKSPTKDTNEIYNCDECNWEWEDPDDPRITDDWLVCIDCGVHLHESCSKDNRCASCTTGRM